MEQNQDRFWSLLQPEHLRARAFCRKLAGGREDGDDLYQDALMTAYVRMGDLQKEESFRPWLYRIMINSFRNRVRKKRPETELTEAIAERTGGEDPSARYAARRRLERAFAALNEREQGLVVLADLQGWGAGEIAAALGVSTGLVKVRLHRARRKMRKVLLASAKADAAKETSTETEGDICVAD